MKVELLCSFFGMWYNKKGDGYEYIYKNKKY